MKLNKIMNKIKLQMNRENQQNRSIESQKQSLRTIIHRMITESLIYQNKTIY